MNIIKEFLSHLRQRRAVKRYTQERRKYHSENKLNTQVLGKIVEKVLNKPATKGFVMYHPDQLPALPPEIEKKANLFTDLDIFLYGKEKIAFIRYIIKTLEVKRIERYYFDIDTDEWKSVKVKQVIDDAVYALIGKKPYYIGEGHDGTLWLDGSTVEALVSKKAR